MANTNDQDVAERKYSEMRAFVQRSCMSDKDIDAWLRDSLKDEPDWLQKMVLDRFGYDIRWPPGTKPPRGTVEDFYIRK